MEMKLRDYQREAIDAVYQVWHDQTMANPLVVAPTGSGKSAILGAMTADITAHPDSRVIVLTHRAELIEQDADKIRKFTSEKVGIYSAGLNQRDMRSRIIVAGIASVYKRATRFEPFDVIIIDECHLISRNGNTMYGKFISEAKLANPRVKIVGLSATPFRMDSGYLHKGEGAMFDGIAYEIGVKMLLEMGYLSPLTSKSGSEKIDLSSVHKRGGEWIPSELAAMADTDSLTQLACDEICALGHNRKTWIIFCTSVAHAEHVRDAMRERGISCEMVTGDTPKTERDDIYKRYNSGELRCITNCQVLTTGFDAPSIDLVALLTSTESTGLYVQMVGRGTRIAPNKTDCLLLDYGNNVITHGVFDDVKPKFKNASGDGESLPPAKECPNCAEVLHAAVRHCPVCNHEFPPPAVIHNVTAYNGAVLSEQVKPELYEVTNVRYKVHKKAGKPDSIRIDYECGLLAAYSEWVCPEHEGFARRKFEQRCATEWKITPPAKCNEFLDIADNVPKPKAIYVRQVPGSKFNEITKREYQ